MRKLFGTRTAASQEGSDCHNDQRTSSSSFYSTQVSTPSSQSLSRTSTTARLASGGDAGILLARLLPALTTSQIVSLPILRGLRLAPIFADTDFCMLEPLDQALYLMLSALAARFSDDACLVGSGGPSLRQLGRNRMLRQKKYLSQFGSCRESAATKVLQSGLRKVNESGAFALPDMRAVSALVFAESAVLCECAAARTRIYPLTALHPLKLIKIPCLWV